MILVTGATGGFGNNAIRALLKKGVPASQIAALVRDVSKAGDLKALGVAIRTGNYSDYDSLLSAFRGADQLLFVSGSEVEERAAQHDHVVRAAMEAGVDHVVYTSFIRNTPIAESAIGFLQETHLQTENWLKASGLKYTILQNGPYLENLSLFLGERVLETSRITLPAADGKSRAVLREELAEAAAHVLVTPGHDNQTYPLTHPDAHSYREVATILSDIGGRDILYESPDPDAFQDSLQKQGVPEGMVALLTAFSVAQANGELNVADGHLEDLLGRKPASVREFLEKSYQ